MTLPKIMQFFLKGRIKELKPFLGEAVYNKLAAESRVRKKEGITCSKATIEKGSPIITLVFMCQQMYCVRKKETGEIVEGAEDDIKAYHYVMAVQREYNVGNGEKNVYPYLGSLSMSRSLPFFFQKMVGDGVPLGAAQIKRAVPPLTTPVSLGSSRNLSLKTGKKVLEVKRFDLKFLQISLCRENIKQC